MTIWPLFSISAGDGDYWFRILSSDVNKVPVGNYIYIKSLNGNVFGSSEEFKVLALETKEEGFLQINNTNIVKKKSLSTLFINKNNYSYKEM